MFTVPGTNSTPPDNRPSIRGLLWQLTLETAVVLAFCILLRSGVFNAFGEGMADVFVQSTRQ